MGLFVRAKNIGDLVCFVMTITGTISLIIIILVFMVISFVKLAILYQPMVLKQLQVFCVCYWL